jgi:hypothetical protein
VHQYKQKQHVATAVYYDIPESGADPDGDKFVGSEGTHYNVTKYGYDPTGRLNGRERPAAPTPGMSSTPADCSCGWTWRCLHQKSDHYGCVRHADRRIHCLRHAYDRITR